jgi:hypothetical protein
MDTIKAIIEKAKKQDLITFINTPFSWILGITILLFGTLIE